MRCAVTTEAEAKALCQGIFPASHGDEGEEAPYKMTRWSYTPVKAQALEAAQGFSVKIILKGVTFLVTKSMLRTAAEQQWSGIIIRRCTIPSGMVTKKDDGASSSAEAGRLP